MRELELVFSVDSHDLNVIKKRIRDYEGIFNKRFLETINFFDFKDEICSKKKIFTKIKYIYDIKFSFEKGEFDISIVNIDSDQIADRRQLIHQVSLHKHELIKKEEELKVMGMFKILTLNKTIEEYLFKGISLKVENDIKISYNNEEYFLNPIIHLNFEDSNDLNPLELVNEKSNLKSLFYKHFQNYAVLTEPFEYLIKGSAIV